MHYLILEWALNDKNFKLCTLWDAEDPATIADQNSFMKILASLDLCSNMKVMSGWFIRILDYEQKQPPRGVLRKRCSENMQQIYRRTPMPKCDFNKVAIELWIIVNCESLRKYFKLRKNIHSKYFQMYIHCTFIWETTFRCAPLFLVNHSIFLWCNFAGNLYDIKCLFIGKNGRKCNIN